MELNTKGSGTRRRVFVTGMGVVSAIGHDVTAFRAALFAGKSGIGSAGAALGEFDFEEAVIERGGRGSALSTRALRAGRRAPAFVQASLISTLEAWRHAGRNGNAVPDSTGLIIAGNNTTSAYCFEQTRTYLENPEKILPSFAVHCLDTDHLATVSEVMHITGPGFTVGGASASGGVAIVEAFEQISSGRLDACLVVAPPAGTSPVELLALRGLGAASGTHFQETPEEACRPFDEDRDGFVPGEAAAALVLEAEQSAAARHAPIFGEIAGGATCLGASRLPTPCAANEARAMRLALERSGVDAAEVIYVNAHATSSRAGDEAEVRAIESVFGEHSPSVWVNSTKSFTGHCLQSAGVVELIAVLLQMAAGTLHPNMNLLHPMQASCRFVGAKPQSAKVGVAMKNSFGFGGIASAVVVRA
jgi:malonyl-ACP decarboxylase